MSFDLRAGLVLALEGSTREASVAAFFRGKTDEIALSADRQHQSDLLPSIDVLTRRLGASPRDLTAVIVGTGPGSYTGLRVAIATALGLGSAARARLLGVPVGEVLCRGECSDGEELALLWDARSSEIYCGRWRRVIDDVVEVEPVRVARADTLAELRLDDAVIVTDMADRIEARFAARILVGAVPRARTLLELGLDRLARGVETPAPLLEPLYLRPFAVTERKR
ncbi:MAG: tRNA (adenosine(37)-N6)-threonylcarbamoyltransferase complex dimerization subunit type 1 TsaB [Planctomycetota bacterium]|nr:tRNA (adenosine(37)-N6)-threonylcarbamoyltransferase complex dimerization subunit type 1 TsaB [Planctomycetota bacterium]